MNLLATVVLVELFLNICYGRPGTNNVVSSVDGVSDDGKVSFSYQTDADDTIVDGVGSGSENNAVPIESQERILSSYGSVPASGFQRSGSVYGMGGVRLGNNLNSGSYGVQSGLNRLGISSTNGLGSIDGGLQNGVFRNNLVYTRNSQLFDKGYNGNGFTQRNGNIAGQNNVNFDDNNQQSGDFNLFDYGNGISSSGRFSRLSGNGVRAASSIYGGSVNGDSSRLGGSIRAGSSGFGGSVNGDSSIYGGSVSGGSSRFGGSVNGDSSIYGGSVSGDSTRLGGSISGGTSRFGGSVNGDSSIYGGSVSGGSSRFGGSLSYGNGSPRLNSIYNSGPSSIGGIRSGLQDINSGYGNGSPRLYTANSDISNRFGDIYGSNGINRAGLINGYPRLMQSPSLNGYGRNFGFSSDRSSISSLPMSSYSSVNLFPGNSQSSSNAFNDDETVSSSINLPNTNSERSSLSSNNNLYGSNTQSNTIIDNGNFENGLMRFGLPQVKQYSKNASPPMTYMTNNVGNAPTGDEFNNNGNMYETQSTVNNRKNIASNDRMSFSNMNNLRNPLNIQNRGSSSNDQTNNQNMIADVNSLSNSKLNNNNNKDATFDYDGVSSYTALSEDMKQSQSANYADSNGQMIDSNKGPLPDVVNLSQFPMS